MEPIRKPVEEANAAPIEPVIAPAITLPNGNSFEAIPLLPIKDKKESETEYELCETHVPFMGAYYEQACLPAKPDEIKYLNNKIIQQCKVTYYDADINKNVGVYDTGKLDKKDFS